MVARMLHLSRVQAFFFSFFLPVRLRYSRTCALTKYLNLTYLIQNAVHSVTTAAKNMEHPYFMFLMSNVAQKKSLPLKIE